MVGTPTDRSVGTGGPLLLLDSASLWFRAFYGVPESVTAPDGTPVNAVRGFLDYVARLITENEPSGLVCCLDLDWRPRWRVAKVPTYKAHRVAEPVPTGTDVEEVPDALAPQVSVILASLEALGIATAGAEDFEADDVIATLAARAQPPVDVVTGDRDLFQVVRPGVRVLYTVEKGRPYDEAAVAAKYDIPTAAAYADFALLRGDPSDGLPGVPGVGAKTAAALLTRYGSAVGALAAHDAGEAVPGGAKLAAARDYLLAAGEVMPVRTDVPLGPVDPALPASPADPEALLALSRRYGIDRSLSRVVTALTARAAAVQA